MDSLFILVPVALVFVLIAIRLFMWSVKSGQFDDLDTEARRILFDRDQRSGKGQGLPSGATTEGAGDELDQKDSTRRDL